MGKILVGFDFSSGSARAVDLAIDIANGWQCDLRLVYVKEKDEDEAPIRAEIERRNQGVAHLLKGIKLEYVILQGRVPEMLSLQAVKDEAELIVVGSRGMSGAHSNFIGVNTYRTIAVAPVPVLSVREEAKFDKHLDTIILPIDSTPATRQKVPMAVKFAQLFGSRIIIILGIYTSTSEGTRANVDNYVGQSAKFIAKAGVAYSAKFISVQKNFADTTLQFAEENQGDLIVIMTEQKSGLTNFLLGSFAQQMLNQATIPILTVKPENIGINTRWN